MPMEFINQNVLLIGLVVVSGLSLVWQLVSRPSGNSVSPVEATLLINREDAHILDVREADEYAAGHLPGAILLAAMRRGWVWPMSLPRGTCRRQKISRPASWLTASASLRSSRTSRSLFVAPRVCVRTRPVPSCRSTASKSCITSRAA